MALLSESERRDFWEICEDRYQMRSTILTSQLPVSRWHEQIGDPTLADGIPRQAGAQRTSHRDAGILCARIAARRSRKRQRPSVVDRPCRPAVSVYVSVKGKALHTRWRRRRGSRLGVR